MELEPGIQPYARIENLRVESFHRKFIESSMDALNAKVFIESTIFFEFVSLPEIFCSYLYSKFKASDQQ